MATKLVCSTCGFYGEPKMSFGIANSKAVCQKCGGSPLIPADSPMGEKMLRDSGVSNTKDIVAEAARESKKKSKKRRYFEIAFVAIGVILVWIFIFNSSSESQKSETSNTPSITEQDKKDIDKVVLSLQTSGLIKSLEVDSYTAYVNLYKWSSLNIKDKEKVGAALAVYMSYHHGSGVQMVSIYDWQSGSKLAKYDTWGLKTY